ncbi:MAG: LysR family transcriptional regulator [Parafilimonas sp.]
MKNRKQPKKPSITRARGPKVTDWTAAYLVALAECGHCGKAAEAAGTSYTAVWRLRQNDPEFAKAYDEALGIAANMLEAEAVRRAKEGLRQYKFSKTGQPLLHPETGQPYFEHSYSDTLLVALLKRFFPKEYKDRQEIEHSGQVGMTLEEFRKRVQEAGA